ERHRCRTRAWRSATRGRDRRPDVRPRVPPGARSCLKAQGRLRVTLAPVGGSSMRMRRYAPILILALAGCGPCGYNRIVTEEQAVEAAWSQVENQLQRRADLIPNLVETVKGYARHEKGVFDDIANARARSEARRVG